MSDKTDLIDQKIEELVPSESKWDSLIHSVNLIPEVGGMISSWITDKRFKQYQKRCVETLKILSNTIKELRARDKEIFIDDNFGETTTKVLPRIVDTINRKKRKRYAYLLSNAAMTPEEEKREEVNTMAEILNQLEYKHVELLDTVMRQEYVQNVDMLWGPQRKIKLDRSILTNYQGTSLHRLKYMGLLHYEQVNIENNSESVEVILNSLGIKFHRWITSPIENN